MAFFRRRILLATLGYGVIAFFTIVLMIYGRSRATSYIPRFIEGSLPNFAATALAPVLLMFSTKKYTQKSYLRFIMIVFSAMCLYEFFQLWMPRRTFDWNDILASLFGAFVAMLAGRLIPFSFLISEPK